MSRSPSTVRGHCPKNDQRQPTVSVSHPPTGPPSALPTVAAMLTYDRHMATYRTATRSAMILSPRQLPLQTTSAVVHDLHGDNGSHASCSNAGDETTSHQYPVRLACTAQQKARSEEYVGGDQVGFASEYVAELSVYRLT